MLTNGRPKRAPRTAILRSQPRARQHPPPTASPLIRATEGNGISLRAWKTSRNTPTPSSAFRGSAFAAWISEKSPPAQNALPAPVRTRTRADSSWASSLRAWSSSWPSARDSALRRSGRLRVRVTTPSFSLLTRSLIRLSSPSPRLGPLTFILSPPPPPPPPPGGGEKGGGIYRGGGGGGAGGGGGTPRAPTPG